MPKKFINFGYGAMDGGDFIDGNATGLWWKCDRECRVFPVFSNLSLAFREIRRNHKLIKEHCGSNLHHYHISQESEDVSDELQELYDKGYWVKTTKHHKAREGLWVVKKVVEGEMFYDECGGSSPFGLTFAQWCRLARKNKGLITNKGVEREPETLTDYVSIPRKAKCIPVEDTTCHMCGKKGYKKHFENEEMTNTVWQCIDCYADTQEMVGAIKDEQEAVEEPEPEPEPEQEISYGAFEDRLEAFNRTQD